MRTLDTVRNAIARLLVTHHYPNLVRDALDTPITDPAEADQTAMVLVASELRLMDYVARQHADRAVQTAVQEINALHNPQAMVREFLMTAEGQEYARTLIIGHPSNVMLINQLIDRRATNVRVRDRWHIPSMFSWLGAIIGAVVGFVLAIVFNTFVDATPLNGSIDGKQFVVGTAIDTFPIQVGVFAVLMFVFAALGGALFHRDDRTSA